MEYKLNCNSWMKKKNEYWLNIDFVNFSLLCTEYWKSNFQAWQFFSQFDADADTDVFWQMFDVTDKCAVKWRSNQIFFEWKSLIWSHHKQINVINIADNDATLSLISIQNAKSQQSTITLFYGLLTLSAIPFVITVLFSCFFHHVTNYSLAFHIFFRHIFVLFWFLK